MRKIQETLDGMLISMMTSREIKYHPRRKKTPADLRAIDAAEKKRARKRERNLMIALFEND